MAAPGRPTPQPDTGDRPRFRDRRPEDYRRPDVNPFVASHRTFGFPLLPASEAWPWRGRWAEHFGRDAPLHVEIGSGNGFFLTQMARRNPDWNWIGIELRYKRTVLCAKKLTRAGVSNARVVRYHAAYLDDLFEADSLSGLYVNHPDPWPKEKHEKNRLISRWFLEDAARLLRVGGWLRVKSDFWPNVERIVELLGEGAEGDAMAPLPFEITGRSDDVITGPAPWEDDVESNYQRKSRLLGEPVFAIALSRIADDRAQASRRPRNARTTGSG